MSYTYGTLVKAAGDGNLRRVKEFLDQGADIEETDSDGDTALNEAARLNHKKVVMFLLERGANLNARGDNDYNAQQWAEDSDNTEIADLLKQAAKQRRAAAKLPAETWIRMGTDRVAFVGTYPQAHKKLTDIFDFARRERLIVTDDLITKAESAAPLISFEELPDATIETALAQFTRLGGVADPDFVLHGMTRIEKRKNVLSK